MIKYFDFSLEIHTLYLLHFLIYIHLSLQPHAYYLWPSTSMLQVLQKSRPVSFKNSQGGIVAFLSDHRLWSEESCASSILWPYVNILLCLFSCLDRVCDTDQYVTMSVPNNQIFHKSDPGQQENPYLWLMKRRTMAARISLPSAYRPASSVDVAVQKTVNHRIKRSSFYSLFYVENTCI